jgi:LmbE family N-acetylglucosaminyl deacetylase
MRNKIFTYFTIVIIAGTATMAVGQDSNDEKLRIIVFGAHPDDAELGTAGVAMKWSALGHHVKLVSVTNGDIGHWNMAGGPLAQRRTREVMEAGRLLGVTNEVLDIHDGELMPTLENRRKITRLIREWKADVVITHRPNDYHPDHRYTSILVQDSAYMVTVKYFCPDTPFLKKNPVYLYTPDRFKKPNPFKADVAVGIDDVVETVLDALMVMESQFYEGGANGYPGIVPEDQAGQDRRRKEVRNRFASRYRRLAEANRETLSTYYGPERARQIQYAQIFEICEYGRQPSQQEIRKIFPFFLDGRK